MKLTASGVTQSAAITKSPSFSRSASSTTITISPRRIAAIASSMGEMPVPQCDRCARAAVTVSPRPAPPSGVFAMSNNWLRWRKQRTMPSVRRQGGQPGELRQRRLSAMRGRSCSIRDVLSSSTSRSDRRRDRRGQRHRRGDGRGAGRRRRRRWCSATSTARGRSARPSASSRPAAPRSPSAPTSPSAADVDALVDRGGRGVRPRRRAGQRRGHRDATASSPTRPRRQFDRVFAINVKGTLFGCQAALRVMAPQGLGQHHQRLVDGDRHAGTEVRAVRDDARPRSRS